MNLLTLQDALYMYSVDIYTWHAKKREELMLQSEHKMASGRAVVKPETMEMEMETEMEMEMEMQVCNGSSLVPRPPPTFF